MTRACGGGREYTQTCVALATSPTFLARKGRARNRCSIGVGTLYSHVSTRGAPEALVRTFSAALSPPPPGLGGPPGGDPPGGGPPGGRPAGGGPPGGGGPAGGGPPGGGPAGSGPPGGGPDGGGPDGGGELEYPDGGALELHPIGLATAWSRPLRLRRNCVALSLRPAAPSCKAEPARRLSQLRLPQAVSKRAGSAFSQLALRRPPLSAREHAPGCPKRRPASAK
eukprot:scaffold62153_cov61-Phaeocystis_antarctica.AAC.5